jgi:MarR family transcriptional regulator, organic hydroperoxide resistance regulator
MILDRHKPEEKAATLRWLLLKVQRDGSYAYSTMLRDFGLGPVQAEVLLKLADGGPLPMKELAARLVCHSGNVSRLVERMVREGFVSRREAEHDRRIALVELTAQGTALARRIQPVSSEMNSRLAELLSPAEIDAGIHVLGKLAEND